MQDNMGYVEIKRKSVTVRLHCSLTATITQMLLFLVLSISETKQ